MKIDLSCDIARDLLPTYIDKLASQSTIEAVEEHLKQCEDCTNIYVSMKEENNDCCNNNVLLESEKMLFKKISHKVNTKVRMAVVLGIIGVIGAIGIMHFMFNTSIKKVPANEVTVSAEVYPLEKLIVGEYRDLSDNTVVISKNVSSDVEAYYNISIPNAPNFKIAVSKNMLESGNYLSYITWESPYLLKDIECEIQSVDNQQIMYVRGFKTTLLNNKVSNNGTIIPMLEFQKIDEIVYIETDGTQNVLWENTAD